MENDPQREASELERVFWACYNNANRDVQDVFAIAMLRHVFNDNMKDSVEPFVREHPYTQELRYKLEKERIDRRRDLKMAQEAWRTRDGGKGSILDVEV